jgi:cation transport regulator
MRYRTIQELPAGIKYTLPPEIQEAYLRAYNKAWQDFRGEPDGPEREAAAHQLALKAIEQDNPAVQDLLAKEGVSSS